MREEIYTMLNEQLRLFEGRLELSANSIMNHSDKVEKRVEKKCSDLNGLLDSKFDALQGQLNAMGLGFDGNATLIEICAQSVKEIYLHVSKELDDLKKMLATSTVLLDPNTEALIGDTSMYGKQEHEDQDGESTMPLDECPKGRSAPSSIDVPEPEVPLTDAVENKVVGTKKRRSNAHLNTVSIKPDFHTLGVVGRLERT